MESTGDIRPQQGVSDGQWLFLVHFCAATEPAKAAATAAAVKSWRTMAAVVVYAGTRCRVRLLSAVQLSEGVRRSSPKGRRGGI